MRKEIHFTLYYICKWPIVAFIPHLAVLNDLQTYFPNTQHHSIEKKNSHSPNFMKMMQTDTNSTAAGKVSKHYTIHKLLCNTPFLRENPFIFVNQYEAGNFLFTVNIS